MKYKIGQTVYVNKPESLWHGKPGKVTRTKKRGYRYEVHISGEPFAYWFPGKELGHRAPQQ